MASEGKGSPTQVPQEPTRAGIRVARTDDSCQLVAPHALLSCAMACGASKRKEEVVRERRALRVVVVERSEEVGRPLPMRMRMNMLVCNVTPVGVLMLRRWRPVH